MHTYHGRKGEKIKEKVRTGGEARQNASDVM